MGRWSKPPVGSQIRARDSLSRQLVMSFACGWDRGFGSQFTTTTRERTRGSTVASPPQGAGPLLPSGAVAARDFGLGWQSNNAGWFDWVPPAGIPTFTGTAGFSFACLARPLVIPALNTVNRRVLQRRASGAPTDQGFDAFVDSFTFLSWSFEWSDGVAEQTLRSTTAPSTQRTDLIVGTLRTGTPQLAVLYINGNAEASTALTVIPGNPSTIPVGICGGIGPVNDAGGDTAVGMACIWNRPLTQSEVCRIHADPYALWRT